LPSFVSPSLYDKLVVTVYFVSERRPGRITVTGRLVSRGAWGHQAPQKHAVVFSVFFCPLLSLLRTNAYSFLIYARPRSLLTLASGFPFLIGFLNFCPPCVVINSLRLRIQADDWKAGLGKTVTGMLDIPDVVVLVTYV
jgi:hypothetical protein